MNRELEFKLMAYVDGELDASEARRIQDLLARDADAQAVVQELTQTRNALQSGEPEVKCPDAPEFYWSQIERTIAVSAREKPSRDEVNWLHRLLRVLAPTGAVAVLVALGLMLGQQPKADAAVVPYELYNAVTDSEVFTYVDQEEGTTLIWFSYQDENEFAETEQSDIL